MQCPPLGPHAAAVLALHIAVTQSIIPRQELQAFMIITEIDLSPYYVPGPVLGTLQILIYLSSQ